MHERIEGGCGETFVVDEGAELREGINLT